MSRKVYPVEGRYLNGVPAEPHDCDDEFCVASGAFTTTKPKAEPQGAEEAPPEPEE